MRLVSFSSLEHLSPSELLIQRQENNGTPKKPTALLKSSLRTVVALNRTDSTDRAECIH